MSSFGLESWYNMQKVIYFANRYMVNIESDINNFLEDNEGIIKITNITLTTDDGVYHALVTYEIN